MKEFLKYNNEIKRLCKLHKVKMLYAFGCMVTGHFDKHSDIDLIVDFEPAEISLYADNYYDFKFSLEDLLHRSIDLLEEKAIKNPYFKEAINKQRLFFMDTEIKTWLYDMLSAINEIEFFFIDIPKDFSAYQNNLKTKRAVERNI